MKNFILILSSIILFACSAQKNISQPKEKKEGRKIYGVVSKEYLGNTGQTKNAVQKPKLSLKVDDEYYFIKIANPALNESVLKTMVGKSIEVRGKLVGKGFGGEISKEGPMLKGGVTGTADENTIGHILIYEILEEEN